MVVVLGAAEGEDAARAAVREYQDVQRARAAIEHNVARWRERLSVIAVRTPEPTFDIMLNQWSLYQALACRMWGRTALYQSSGAYGFRDQLQDSMAFVYAEPGVAREHILRATARQFVEGDVQHWWHPESGRGMRTRFSDDLAWLPYVVDHYVRVTGDATVLDETVPYLTMRALEPQEHEVYELPRVSDERGTVYDHCLRALRKACTAGEHGLPLIGIGDWNDGMNRVGVEGRGESVWLAWFLITTLRAFAIQADARDDTAVAAQLRTQADTYAAAVEAHAWDGAWYRRAYFDDGTPLGSSTSDECRIDAIAQSWSVLSGAGAPERQAQAMRSFEQYLVREDARLLMLLTPAIRQDVARPWVYQGLSPRRARERRAIHTRRALVGACDGDTWRRRPRVRAISDAQPAHARADTGRRGGVQGRALCRSGRRLHRSRSSRPRRLDLVHRISELDVSRGARGDTRLPETRRRAGDSPESAERLAGVLDRVSLWPEHVRDRRP